MWFEPCDISKIKTRKRNDLKAILMKIADSNEVCVEIKDHGYTSARSCRSTIGTAIRRYRLKHLRVTTNNKKIYVINTLLVKEVQ